MNPYQNDKNRYFIASLDWLLFLTTDFKFSVVLQQYWAKEIVYILSVSKTSVLYHSVSEQSDTFLTIDKHFSQLINMNSQITQCLF